MKSLVESILGDQDDILQTAETVQIKSSAQFNKDVQIAVSYVKKCIENTGIAFQWELGQGNIAETAYLSTARQTHKMIFQNVCDHMEKAFNDCAKKFKCKYEIEPTRIQSYVGPKLVIYNGKVPFVVIAVQSVSWGRMIEINFPKLTRR